MHIPGPNPIILPGPPGAWDDGVIEAADALRDGPTCYFYYHGTGQGKGYRLGVATASAPLGPFRKHGDRPILDLGPKGSWDDQGVACAMVVPDGPGKYWMWYFGIGASPAHAKWSIGLATAPHPLGPWQKFAGNPILKDFGYVGGVVHVGGKYHLYTAHPIGSTCPLVVVGRSWSFQLPAVETGDFSRHRHSGAGQNRIDSHTDSQPSRRVIPRPDLSHAVRPCERPTWDRGTCDPLQA